MEFRKIYDLVTKKYQVILMEKWTFYIASKIRPRSGYIVARTADEALQLLESNPDANVYPIPSDVDLPEGRGPVWDTQP
jgi:hypothetical protein